MAPGPGHLTVHARGVVAASGRRSSTGLHSMLGTRPSVPSFLRVPPAVLPLPELRVPKTRTRIKSSITRRPGDCFDAREITKESKSTHFRRLMEKYACTYEDILFFDNEYGNCREISQLGVTVAFSPDGVTGDVWTEAVAAFPSESIVNDYY